MTAQDDKKLLKQWPVRKTFLYNKTRDRFMPVYTRFVRANTATPRSLPHRIN